VARFEIDDSAVKLEGVSPQWTIAVIAIIIVAVIAWRASNRR
jgi:hypothetical protein